MLQLLDKNPRAPEDLSSRKRQIAEEHSKKLVEEDERVREGLLKANPRGRKGTQYNTVRRNESRRASQQAAKRREEKTH